MRTLTVKQRIYTVLIENKNDFLSINEIAETAYDVAYLKETKKHLNGLIKRNIAHAIAMLSEDGYVVIKDLQRCIKSNKMTYKGVNGYKIADKEDIDLVKENLLTKVQRIEIAEQIRFDFTALAEENKLLKNEN